MHNCTVKTCSTVPSIFIQHFLGTNDIQCNMNSFASSHCKFESNIVHLFFDIILYLVLPMSCESIFFTTAVYLLLEEPVHDKSDV